MFGKNPKKDYFPYCFAMMIFLVAGGAVSLAVIVLMVAKKPAEPVKIAEQTEVD